MILESSTTTKHIIMRYLFGIRTCFHYLGPFSRSRESPNLHESYIYICLFECELDEIYLCLYQFVIAKIGIGV